MWARHRRRSSFSVPLTKGEATSKIYFVIENPLLDASETVKVSATLEWQEKATTGDIVAFIGFIIIIIAGIVRAQL